MYLKTQGLVLRVTEYRDSDAMLTVLTKEQGLMSFKARGVRSRRSQLKVCLPAAVLFRVYAAGAAGILHRFRGGVPRDVPADAKRH